MTTNNLTEQENEGILDTKKIFWNTIKKKKKFIVIFSTICLACFVFPPFIIFVGPLFFIAIIWLSITYDKIRHTFWNQLALKYKWEYIPIKDIQEEKALLFKTGHSKIASHGINGNYNYQPFHIFEYSYTIGQGKNKQIFSFTVFEIKFTGTFPHLYLDTKHDFYSNMSLLFSSAVRIPLPRDFEKKFELYAPKEYEIEALEIFTPNVLTHLINSGWNHDMEFIDGELVIYKQVKFKNFVELDTELNRIKKFIDIMSPQLNKFKLTPIGDNSPLL
jgi:hypothetical protein